MRTTLLPVILAVLLSLPTLSCTSTTLTATWSDASYEQRPIDSVLVIGIAQDQTAIDKAVRASGASTVLITHVVGVEERTQYNRPSRTYYPAPYHRGMYGYYSRAYDEVYTPGYYTSYQVHELETNLYDSGTGALIWSARSETVAPDNVGRVIDRLVRLLIKDLRRNKLL